MSAQKCIVLLRSNHGGQTRLQEFCTPRIVQHVTCTLQAWKSRDLSLQERCYYQKLHGPAQHLPHRKAEESATFFKNTTKTTFKRKFLQGKVPYYGNLSAVHSIKLLATFSNWRFWGAGDGTWPRKLGEQLMPSRQKFEYFSLHRVPDGSMSSFKDFREFLWLAYDNRDVSDE